MPKRKAVRGRRGGANAGRKASQAAATGDEVEIKTDLNNSQDTAIDVELEAVADNLNEETETGHTVDVALSQEQEVIKCVSDAETCSDLVKSANVEEEKCETVSIEKNLDDNEGTVTEMCQQPEKVKETGQFEDKLETEPNVTILEGDPIMTVTTGILNQEQEGSLTEQQEEIEDMNNAGSNEGIAIEECFVDKEIEGDQKEIEEVQYIDEEASEDQQLVDIIESISSPQTNLAVDRESQKENGIAETSENPVDLTEKFEVSTEIINSSVIESQKNEEIDDSKFEEISEGSINQDQEELGVEAISDVEIIGESFVPKKTRNDKDVNVQKKKTDVRYKETESLEDVFFATENDFMKITAEDKDNDDISDESLSDHADANLSLEEISDDDLELSKKKKKPSGLTVIKTEKVDNNTKPDEESVNISDEKSEFVKTNQTGVTLPKRPANDDIEGTEKSSGKKLKMSNETKDTEETSKNEIDLTVASGDSKKDGKKSQVKESDISQVRNVLNKRILTQSSKTEQLENREKPLASKDLVEHRRRFELVSSSCQTEPRMMKGKIIQCNINPIKTITEACLQEEKSENGIIVTQLLNKFRNQLPASIPEKIFSDVTSLQPPLKASTFSFSMGPVTLSDMDHPKFREVLRGADEFSLAFDKQCQGILKATIASHESLTTLISKLKSLELGNRYMLMSVVYKCGSEASVDVWKATLMYMYEQDIQIESQSLVNDGKVRAKLGLKGVPKGVSKEFIHLLFPEAINVGTGPGTLDERTVSLGFSSTKMVEEILSCYDLLIICGSQINIAHMDSAESQQRVPADLMEESETIVIEDTKDTEEISEKQEICINLDLDQEDSQQQKPPETHTDIATKDENESSKQIADSNQDQTKEVDLNSNPDTDKLITNLTEVQDQKKEEENVSQDSDIITIKSDTQCAAEKILAETACTPDLSAEHREINSNDAPGNVAMRETSLSKKAKNDFEGAVVIILDDDDDNDKSSEKDVVKPSDEAATIPITIAEGVSSLNTNIPGNNSTVISEVELVEAIASPVDGVAKTLLEDVDRGSAEVKVCDKSKKNKDKISENEASKETNNENLEDVSDEEIGNHSKNDDADDVVILKEDSSQWVAASIDLTNEESNTSGKALNESTKDVTEEKSKQLVNHDRRTDDSNVKVDPGDNTDLKLVMTDGDLEVLMEVIDVDEDVNKVDKVIYARTWQQPQGRSRERNKWDTGYPRAPSCAQMPWRENQWSYAGKPDTYYGPREPYHHSPPVENMPRPQGHFPVPFQEGSPAFRAPAREQTSYRREPYQNQRRYQLPLQRDAGMHGHPGAPMPDHWVGNTEHWDRRYDNWQPNTFGDSRRTDSYPRQTAEPSGRPAQLQSRGTAYRPSYTSRKDHHESARPSERDSARPSGRDSARPSERDSARPSERDSARPSERGSARPSERDSARPSDRYSHNDSRGAHYRDRRRDYRKSRTRSRSLSDMSDSSGHPSPIRRSSYRRESPKRSVVHISRSPISVSSRSRSLSPVSKSPSVEYTQGGAGKKELVKTVKQFLQLAKGIQHAQKRRSNHSRSPKSPSFRHSKSPLPIRLSSPHEWKVRSSRHSEIRSPLRLRSRSPQPARSRNSRSPSYSKSRRYKYERSPSPSSPGGNYKRHRGDRSYTDKKGKQYRRESESPEYRYESKRSQKTGDISKPSEEQGSRSKSGHHSESKHRSSDDQSWQQSQGGYHLPQTSSAVSSSNVYNPAYPPPGMYSGSSAPTYQYSNSSQYNYSSIPPPYVQNVPPPSVGQSYQSSYYEQSQPYIPTGPLQTSSAGGMSSTNSSKNKKSWSMGTTALAFQRVLGSTKGDKRDRCGAIEKIEDRERLERPKHTKSERVLATVQMERK